MIYDAEQGDFRIVLLGDVMPTRRLAVFREERYLKLREIVRDADAAFANLETCVHQYLEGHLGISGGTYMTTEPHLLEDLKWFGVNFVSTANNHAFDYGEEGVLATCRYLDAAGIVHAGTGRNLREARSPGYLDTAHGRVALVAVTATFNPHSVAGGQRADVTGRPGVNPLRHTTTHVVDDRGLQELRRLGAALGFDAARERRIRLGDAGSRIGAHSDREYSFGSLRFERGDAFALRTEGNKRDIEENLQQIKEARRMSDWVMVSLHCHELGGEKLMTASLRSEIEEFADFAVDFAHRAIDAGADIFIGHGPQEPFGVELIAADRFSTVSVPRSSSWKRRSFSQKRRTRATVLVRRLGRRILPTCAIKTTRWATPLIRRIGDRSSPAASSKIKNFRALISILWI